jgi:hypothetical protein
MSDILRRLRERNQELDNELHDQFIEQRDFSAREIQRIGKDAIDKMVEMDFRSVTNENPFELEYKDDRHIAWVLADWPPNEFPREVIESYDVILVDTGEVLSRTKYWEQAGGGVDLEPYDPSRYELTTMNANTIYFTLAKLPGDSDFKDDNLKRIPR